MFRSTARRRPGNRRHDDRSTRGCATDRRWGSDLICLGGVADSNLPHCSGPELVGVEWADVPDIEKVRGVTFGEARVVGRFDGTTFTLTQAPSAPMIPVEPEGGT